jgi:solute carrier family 39 (zinc transporter), member 1/2/3
MTDLDHAAQLKFVQGIMAALSAGLLIYAATVEMLAADFVLAAGPEGLARAHPGKQALALVSLFAGAAGMSIIGYVRVSCFECAVTDQWPA